MSEVVSAWEGFYKTFREAKVNVDAFESEIWISNQRKRILGTLQKYNKRLSKTRDYPLPITHYCWAFVFSERLAFDS